MPAPNPLNPYHCDHPMRRDGKTKSGAQKYRCKCGHTYTDSDRPWGSTPNRDLPRDELGRFKKND